MSDSKFAATAEDGQSAGHLIWRLIATQAAPLWRTYAVCMALMALMAACIGSSAMLIQKVVDEAYSAHDMRIVGILCIASIALFVVRGLAAYGYELALAYAGSAITSKNRKLLFDKLLQESVGHISDHNSSETVARFSSAVASSGDCLNLIVTTIGRDGLALLAMATVMFVEDPFMSIIVVVLAPVAIWSARDLRRRLQSKLFSEFLIQTQLTETIYECLRGIRIVKAFELEGVMRRRAEAQIDAVTRTELELARLRRRGGPILEALAGCVIALILLYGSYRIIALRATPGEFVSFLTAFMLAYDPAKRLARAPVDLSGHLQGLQMLYALLDAPPTEPDDVNKPALQVRGGKIELENVTFRYDGEEAVLHGLSLVSDAGKTTALVGKSGSGKSTVFNLLLRLYEVEAGTIRIDGQDISRVTRHSVRQAIAYVGQDIFLFNGTIGENIAFGRPDADPSDIVAAAKAAHAHGFIIDFPEGYDTPVGEHGLRLSTGQRQRVSIARALLKRAPIVILDEPTASLDSSAEREVNRAIAELTAGRTTLVIAHRLQTVRTANCIYFVDKGIVTESGRHVDLLCLGGAYASLYRLQFGGDVELSRKAGELGPGSYNGPGL